MDFERRLGQESAKTTNLTIREGKDAVTQVMEGVISGRKVKLSNRQHWDELDKNWQVIKGTIDGRKLDPEDAKQIWEKYKGQAEDKRGGEIDKGDPEAKRLAQEIL